MSKETMKNNSIKKENRKALKVFIPVIIVAAAFGGAFGFFSQDDGFQHFFTNLGVYVEEAVCVSAPYLVILTEVLTFLAAIVYYRKAKVAYKEYEKLEAVAESEEDEEKLDGIFQKTDRELGIALIIIGLGMLFSFMFFGIFMTYLLPILDNLKFTLGITTTGVFIAGMFANLKVQQLSVDLVKKMNPKMRGSVYDMKFNKKWEESCDEAEKMTIYKASYKAFQTANMTCSVLWVVTCMGDLLFHFGSLPVVTVSVIWIAMHISYYIENFRLEHGKINE